MPDLVAFSGLAGVYGIEQIPVGILDRIEVVKGGASSPYWGARKIAQVLRNEGAKHVPASSTITAILRRQGELQGLVDGVGSGPCQRFERSAPNELWQMDFKGDFLIHDRKRCYPLTACDDHSRYNLLLEPCANQKSLTVQAQLQQAFERYGLPLAILCDNGPPWASNWATHTYNQLEVGSCCWASRSYTVVPTIRRLKARKSASTAHSTWNSYAGSKKLPGPGALQASLRSMAPGLQLPTAARGPGDEGAGITL